MAAAEPKEIVGEDPVGTCANTGNAGNQADSNQENALAQSSETQNAADEAAEEAAREKARREKEARAQALTLEIVGDLPYAEVKPPENVLFVCKLNPVTEGLDLPTKASEMRYRAGY